MESAADMPALRTVSPSDTRVRDHRRVNIVTLRQTERSLVVANRKCPVQRDANNKSINFITENVSLGVGNTLDFDFLSKTLLNYAKHY